MGRRRLRCAAGAAVLATALAGAAASGPCLGGEPATADPAADVELRASLRRLADGGDAATLLRVAEAQLAAHADSVPALEYRAFALQKMGRVGAARDAYRAVLALRPNHAWALTRLARLLVGTGEFTEAEELALRAMKLDPTSHESRRVLVAVRRGRLDFVGADATVREALREGDDAAWCHAQLVYLHWALGETEAAIGELERARAAGAPSEETERLARLLRWDVEARHVTTSGPRPTEGDGPWTFFVGGVTVVSGLGPKLPAEIERRITELPALFRAWTGAVGPSTRVTIHLHRTIEEHEELRRARFPAGSPGRSFLERENGGPGRGRGGFAIHVPWPADSPATSLAHELAHAAIYDATSFVPTWLDEGLATYFEIGPGDGVSRGPRPDLDATLRAAMTAERALPLVRLFAADRDEFEGADARGRYAQAWSVVRFLVDGAGDEAARKRRVADLFVATSSPRSREDPLRAIAGAAGIDPGEFERTWRESVR